MALRREMPEAIEMEKKLLSAMMLKESIVIPAVASILKDEDFYREEHKIIYRALLKSYNEGTPPDILMVEQKLREAGELERVNRNYLFSLINAEFTTSRAEKFAEIIKGKALLRQLIESCDEIIAMAYEEQPSVESILNYAERKVFSVSTKKNQTGFEKIDSIVNNSFNKINYRHNNPGETTGVKTGLIDLDKILNGLQKSDLILLAARPSMGKTALALNIAVNAAKKGNVVAVFSLEMSKNQLGDRMLSSESGVNSLSLKNGDFPKEDLPYLVNAADELSNLNLYIDDTAGITLTEMRAKIRRFKQEHGLDLVLIDYLQLMQGGGRQENRQQEISEISRSLKALARELDVPILALSQLSRSVEMRAEKKPQLSDLRESGSLEQDADIVMFLYRDEYYNRNDTGNENIAELIIAKNRNGPTDSKNLQFQKEIMKFRDYTKIAE